MYNRSTPHSCCILVVDTGGTKTRIAIWDGAKINNYSSFNTPARKKESSEKNKSIQAQREWILFIKRKVDEYIQLYPNIDHVSIGLAGSVKEDGTILSAPNIWGSSAPPITRPELEKILQRPLTITNDVTAAIYRYGKDKKYSHCRRISLITISTGIGSKTFDIKHGKAILDQRGLIGEIGQASVELHHLSYNPSVKGRLEQYASGKGISEMAKLMALDNNHISLYKESSLLSLLKKSNLDIQSISYKELSPLILSCALHNDLFSNKVIYESVKLLAYIIHIIILNDAPDKIILVGGFAQNAGEFYRHNLVKQLILLEVNGYSNNELDNMIELGINDDYNGLIGSGLIAIHKKIEE